MVDFDFSVANNISNPTQAGFTPLVTNSQGTLSPAYIAGQNNQGVSIAGLQNIPSNPAMNGIFTTDLTIPFQQGSYALAVPQFGGYDASANAGATLGFAIMSNIEAYFFIQAAQGDKRTNVLQAPKVTLFNGQQAFVSDTSQTPFVISVIPVVGDFAAAQQPVIVVLSEGTFMTVQAVVSNDRRYVRLTIVLSSARSATCRPLPSRARRHDDDQYHTQRHRRPGAEPLQQQYRPVDDFALRRDGAVADLLVHHGDHYGQRARRRQVLLGGIKRLSEGRTEYGVPILDKIPYLDRLFKNVGIGRDTSSLMMMVTPRIIIQEEEEEKLGVVVP